LNFNQGRLIATNRDELQAQIILRKISRVKKVF